MARTPFLLSLTQSDDAQIDEAISEITGISARLSASSRCDFIRSMWRTSVCERPPLSHRCRVEIAPSHSPGAR